jgi:hypothetical protein
MSRPKIKNKKKAISLSIDTRLDLIVNDFCKEKNITKSKYIQHLIEKDNNI